MGQGGAKRRAASRGVAKLRSSLRAPIEWTLRCEASRSDAERRDAMRYRALRCEARRCVVKRSFVHSKIFDYKAAIVAPLAGAKTTEANVLARALDNVLKHWIA